MSGYSVSIKEHPTTGEVFIIVMDDGTKEEIRMPNREAAEKRAKEIDAGFKKKYPKT